MYVTREASQGKPLYIDMEKYAKAKTGQKAWHNRVDRIGFQRSAPQNNYRRLIAAYIPADEYCFDTVSYVPRISRTTVDFDVLLAVLNSRLADWYFTIGSTNSKVNEYQFNNLPFPVFLDDASPEDAKKLHEIIAKIDADPSFAVEKLGSFLQVAPFGSVVKGTIKHLASRVRAIEGERGPVAKADRARLSSAAQPYQDAIDRVLFELVGFTPVEVLALNGRMETMS